MMNSLLIVLFFVLPFISIDGRQAILLDVDKQQFSFLGSRSGHRTLHC
ncbi:type cbb3 cytochrome oxidase biogenesis protein CcoG, involved in Cu oxidation [Shewanella sp. HN-41]|nr:type cbb3 cytochrome oxidase biogenesis protein CcoG, involved in Cu oxidation [Shewanella sp. HN-41]